MPLMLLWRLLESCKSPPGFEGPGRPSDLRKIYLYICMYVCAYVYESVYVYVSVYIYIGV